MLNVQVMTDDAVFFSHFVFGVFDLINYFFKCNIICWLCKDAHSFHGILTLIPTVIRHVRRILCINYLAGFCPEGSACTDAHPRFELPAPSDIDPKFGKKVSLA